MNGCMAHPIRWKVAREEGGFCPYCELAEQRSKLEAAEKRIAEQRETINQLNEAVALWMDRAGARAP